MSRVNTFRDPANESREFTGQVEYDWLWDDEEVKLLLGYRCDDSCDESVEVWVEEVLECGLSLKRSCGREEGHVIARMFLEDFNEDTRDLGTPRAVKATVRHAAGLEVPLLRRESMEESPTTA